MKAPIVAHAASALVLSLASLSSAQAPTAQTAPTQAPAAAAAPAEAPGTAAAAPAEVEASAAVAPSPAAEPTDEQKSAAREHLKSGNEQFDAEKFTEALEEFRASYRAVASPNSRLMIGRTLTKLGRLGEAYDELASTVREADERGERYANASEAAKHDLGALRPQVAMLTVTLVDAPAGTLLTIRDRDIPADSIAGAIAVTPGQVTVVAMGDGRTVSAVAELTAGGEGAVELVMTPPPPEPVAAPPAAAPLAPPADDSDDGASLRIAAFVAGGVGVAGLATFGVFGVLNQSKFSDLEDGCPGGVCPPALESDIDQGRMYQTIANVGLIVGIVGVATGATLFVLSSGAGGDQAAGPRLEVAGGLGSVRVKGAF